MEKREQRLLPFLFENLHIYGITRSYFYACTFQLWHAHRIYKENITENIHELY